MITKFDTAVEKMENARFERRNEEINRRLMASLKSRTREEVVSQMLGELTIVVGSGAVLSTAKTLTKQPQMLLESRKTLDFFGEKV